jgi:ABC-type bacteriocin/lantibiotic exporter with double-glycine peptidase domain
MKKNMGSADRIIRILIAASIAVLYFTHILTGTWALVLMAFAIVFVLTGFISFCPLYLPFGIRTNKTKITDPEK